MTFKRIALLAEVQTFKTSLGVLAHASCVMEAYNLASSVKQRGPSEYRTLSSPSLAVLPFVLS